MTDLRSVDQVFDDFPEAEAQTERTGAPQVGGNGNGNGKSAQEIAGPTRPMIVANGRDLREISLECQEALIAGNNPPHIFVRGTELVRIVKGKIEILTESKLRHELARVAAFFEESAKKKLTPCPPPIEVVRDIPTWANQPFSELVRIVHGPTFDQHGWLLTEPGYHGGVKAYIDRSIEVPAFEGDGKDAAQWILDELFADFPFASQADRANAIGALLTCCARDTIVGSTPLHGVEASIHGAGKGLLVDLVSISAFGRPGAEMAAYSENEEEMRKHITASLRMSPGAIKWDNVKDRIDSPSLSAMLMTDLWSDRILGRNEIISLPVRAVSFATGNNPSLAGEIARRYVRIRLTPSTETPWTRTGFRHENLLEWTEEHRGEILGAVAQMLRTWIEADNPAWSGHPLGSFESWSRIVGGILEACDVMGFMANHAELFETADSDGEAWRQIVDVWAERFSNRPVVVSDLFPLAQGIDGFPLKGTTEHAQRIGFGRALARQKDRVYDDKRIVREESKKHGAIYLLQMDIKGMSGNKGNVPTAPHARELFPYGTEVENIPHIPNIPQDEEDPIF